MFRASVQKQYAVIDETGEKASEDTGEKADTKPAAKSQREIMAAAAEKRFVTDGSPEPKRAKIEVDSHKAAKTNDDTQEVNKNGCNEEDDVVLALEMIETSLHGLLAKVAATSESQDELTISNELKDWALNQLPRFMVCLGDVYAFREEHGKAVDAYIRALSYREDKWKEMKGKNEPCSIEHLQSHRLYIEACTLVAEALLACPDGEDVVCDGDDKRVTYAKAGERIDYANSWYAMAREELGDHCKWPIYCVHFFNSILSIPSAQFIYLNSNAPCSV